MKALRLNRTGFKVNLEYSPHRVKRLSLSKQAELVSDALLIGNSLELLTDIENRPDAVSTVDISILDNTIQLIEKMKKGEDYLLERRANLRQRPETADTVRFIQDRVDIRIGENSDIAITALKQLRNWPTILTTEQIDKTKHLLRAIHTGIMDQLEAFEVRIQDNPGTY